MIFPCRAAAGESGKQNVSMNKWNTFHPKETLFENVKCNCKEVCKKKKNDGILRCHRVVHTFSSSLPTAEK